MDEYEFSYDNVLFLDTQMIGELEEEFIASLVWLHNFQWSSWTQGVDDSDVFISQWKNADLIVYFDPQETLLSTVKDQFGVNYSAAVNLVDYCEDSLMDTARETEIVYPDELDTFSKEDLVKLWIDFVQGDRYALNTLLYVSAWRTNLIYNIFFKACGLEVPIKVFIPWQLEEPKVYHRVVSDKLKGQEKALYDSLKTAYDFSSPNATRDD